MKVLVSYLGSSSKKSQIDKGRLFFHFSRLRFEFSAYGDTGTSDGCTALGVSDLYISGKIACQNNFVVHKDAPKVRFYASFAASSAFADWAAPLFAAATSLSNCAISLCLAYFTVKNLIRSSLFLRFLSSSWIKAPGAL